MVGAHPDLEGEVIEGSKAKLTPLIALAVVGDETAVTDMWPELKRRYGPEGSQVVNDCNAGSHGDFHGDPEELVKATNRFAKWLTAQR